MSSLSSVFLILSLVLAVVIGPQTRAWTWGPSELALGCSVLAALPVFWRRGRSAGDLALLTLGALAAAWFAWRAWISPVPDFGQADLLLLAGAVGAFVSVRAIRDDHWAERILTWGVALLLLASVVVIGMQIVDPTYTPVFRARADETMVSGFFAHYNYGANFLIVASTMVGAAAVAGRQSAPTRVLFALIAIAGLAGVWFTRSRGGIFGAAAACGVFAVVLLILGKRRNAKWFAPAVVAIPLVGLGIGAFLFMGWQARQEMQQPGSGVDSLMDNTIRLYLLGLAASCVGLHPLAGGGSRSFGWECYRFWETGTQGAGGVNPGFAHNEFMQAATDYGLLGAGLLFGLLAALVLAAILRVLFEERDGGWDHRDAWRLGALAALAGILTQSFFSFVFHLMPGALLLGICLGQLSRGNGRSPSKLRTTASRILLSLAAVSCAFPLFGLGWKGLRVTHILWPTYFSKQAATSAESRIDSLTASIGIWPRAEFYQDRARIFQELAGTGNQPEFREFANRAIDDYEAASRLNPFDPGPEVNRANLLSQLGRDRAAEDAYARAIALQGGMEAGFRSHYFLANHYYRKGLRQFAAGAPETALDSLDNAAIQMEKAVGEAPPWVFGVEGRSLRISIYESLGTVREALGDRKGALEAYDFAAAIPTGRRAHYRAGVLIGKKAAEAWSRRDPSVALKWFVEARKRVAQAGKDLPEGVTASGRLEYIDYLDKTIQFLKGAGIKPAD